MTTLSIEDGSRELQAEIAEADRLAAKRRQALATMAACGITPLADLPPITREAATVQSVRFAESVQLADVERAARAIGCRLTTDRRGGIVIAPMPGRSASPPTPLREILDAAPACLEFGSVRA